MNLVELRKRIMRATCALVAGGSIFVAACGGSGSSTETAGIGGTGIGVGGTGIVVGKITGFGSVLVNGGTFDIDTSQFDLDGNTSADQDDLALGMVIRLEVETENGVLTSKALEVVYDDEVEGPVTNIMTPNPTEPSIKTGTIFGQTITFDEASTIFADTSFDSIGEEDVLLDPDVIEVSGFRTSPNEIIATYVRFEEDLTLGTTEVELRGIIGGYSAGPPEMFVLDGVTVNTDGFTEIEVSGPLQDGLNVEVKGIIQTLTSVLAGKIEEEDEDLGDEVEDVSLQGIVLVYNGVNEFFIGNQRIDASAAEEFKPASLEGMDLQGMNIEVEGEIVGGTLIAEEVEARDGDTKLRAPVSSVGGNSFQVTYPVATGPTTVVVNVNGQTLFENETNTPPITDPFSLDDLLASDFVRVEGQEVGGEVVASVVKRIDGVGQDLKLEGAVDSFVTDSSITILGITYDVDPTPVTGTDFEGFASSAQFFLALNPLGGDFVEIEDDDVADGVADEVELE